MSGASILDRSGPVDAPGELMNQHEATGPIGPLLTVAEVADALRVSTMTVYRLVQAGQLPALRVGRNYRIRQQDLDSYLTSGIVPADRSNG